MKKKKNTQGIDLGKNRVFSSREKGLCHEIQDRIFVHWSIFPVTIFGVKNLWKTKAWAFSAVIKF